MLKKIWRDPVWSKVIAAGIITAITATAGIIWPPVRGFLLTASLVPYWLFGLLGLVVVCAIVIVLDANRPKVHVTPVGDVEVGEDKTPGRSFPLKVSCVIRNDSSQSIDVQVFDYTPGTVTLKKFVTDVLQVKLREWYPDKHGVERLAVLPGQQFKAWVGADESRFTKDQLDRLRGQIGSLVLLVNGRRIDISL